MSVWVTWGPGSWLYIYVDSDRKVSRGLGSSGGQAPVHEDKLYTEVTVSKAK